jgi:hypothetical protein
MDAIQMTKIPAPMILFLLSLIPHPSRNRRSSNGNKAATVKQIDGLTKLSIHRLL